jgi:hypothetical protein
VDQIPVLAEDASLERFYAGAIRRILRMLVAIGGILSVPVWWWYGALAACGFVAGVAVSWLNFHSLSRGVEGLASRVVEAHSGERGRVVILRFLLRYLLVGIVAYAIFRGSFQAFRGFLFGLCVPVLAMMSEAVFEAHAAMRRRA